MLVFAASVLLSAQGCSVSPSELPGEYVAKHSAGTLTLQLHPDGKFKEFIDFTDPDYVRLNGSHLECQGNWKAERDGVFLDLAYRFTQEQFGPPRVAQGLPAERSFGEVRLVADPDNDLYYRKTK